MKKELDALCDTAQAQTAESTQLQTATFKDFPLNGALSRGIEDAGYELPTPVQQQAIPIVLRGSDLIAQARTGSGKTAAFMIPCLNQSEDKTALVLVPTRELAQQVTDEARKLAVHMRLKVACVVGGHSPIQQIEAIRSGASVVVATPGRLLDHLKSGRIKSFQPKLLVFDEADEMLDMGFIDDIEAILGFLPKDRQTMLFSATMPEPIRKLAKKALSEPEHIQLNDGKPTHNDIEQDLYIVREDEKISAILRLCDSEQPRKAILFCRTKRDTDVVCENLLSKGIKARAIHSDLNQKARQDAISLLKKGHIQILTATDVASRGLDVSDLTHVINYHLPDQKERYVHRIGRTGRAGRKGAAITLATPAELKYHNFFKDHELNNFKVKTLPNLNDVQKKRSEIISKDLSQTTISSSSKEACKALLDEYDSMELILRLYSHIESDQVPQGPDRIGLSLEQIKSLGRSSSRRESGRPNGRSRSRAYAGGRSASSRSHQGGGSGAGRSPRSRNGFRSGEDRQSFSGGRKKKSAAGRFAKRS